MSRPLPGNYRYKRVESSRIVCDWENKCSPDDIASSADDPLGIKGLTLLTYDLVPLEHRAQSRYVQDSAPRHVRKHGRPAPKDQYIANFVARSARAAAKAILICTDYQVLQEQRACEVNFQGIFPRPDDMFNLSFLMPVGMVIDDKTDVIPTNVENNPYREIMARYSKGSEHIAIMLRRMFDTILPRLKKHFELPVG